MKKQTVGVVIGDTKKSLCFDGFDNAADSILYILCIVNVCLVTL